MILRARWIFVGLISFVSAPAAFAQGFDMGAPPDVSSPADAGTADAGISDARGSDAGTTDAGGSDAGTTDAGNTDAGGADAGGADAGGADAGGADAGGADAADAQEPDADEPSEPPLPCNSEVPDEYHVKVYDGIDPEEVAARYTNPQAGGELLNLWPSIQRFEAHLPPDTLAALENDPDVEQIEPERMACSRAGPDLRVVDFSARFSNAPKNTAVQVTVTIQNLGDANAAASRVTLWRNRTAAPTTATSKTGASSIVIGALAPGQSQTVTTSFTYGSNGTYRIWALADSFAEVVESSEANASYAWVTFVRPNTSRPDLFVKNLTVAPSTALTNTNVTIRALVRNRGAAAAGSFYVSFYKNSPAAPDNTTPKDFSIRVGSLGAGVERWYTFTTNYSSAGTQTIWARADGFDHVNESTETNNNRSASLLVRTRPDLVSTIVPAGPLEVAQGEHIPIAITVSNLGNNTAGASHLGAYLNLADPPVTSTPENAIIAVGALASGASATFNLNAQYGAAGVFRLWSLADSNAEVLEENEANGFFGPVEIGVSIPQVLPTGIRRIFADESTALSGNGSGVVDATIAVIDSGVGPHPDLNVVFSQGFGQYDDGEDESGHGTHVAGIAAARDNSYGVAGVAPGARIWALKVTGPQGGQVGDMISAIDFVRDQVVNHGADVRVINLSLGVNFVHSGLNAAVAAAVNAGIVVVVAADNAADDSAFYSPDSEPSALTIAGLRDLDGEPGGLAAGGDDTFMASSNFGNVIDFIAPGDTIASAGLNRSYVFRTGNSMAAPHVAGLVALIRSANPSFNPAQVRQALLNAVTENIAGIHGEGRTYPLIRANAF